jgi:hypothetical protein
MATITYCQQMEHLIRHVSSHFKKNQALSTIVICLALGLAVTVCNLYIHHAPACDTEEALGLDPVAYEHHPDTRHTRYNPLREVMWAAVATTNPWSLPDTHAAPTRPRLLTLRHVTTLMFNGANLVRPITPSPCFAMGFEIAGSFVTDAEE